jgi:hypothetical protein
MSVRRIVPLTVGWERLPKSYSVHGDTSGETLVEPVPAIALDTDDGWTLIDTGMNPALTATRCTSSASTAATTRSSRSCRRATASRSRTRWPRTASR